jgi:Zn-dependent protease
MNEIDNQSQSRTATEYPPPAIDFIYPSASQAPPPPRRQSKLHQLQSQGGIWGALATILILLAKFGGVLLGLLVKLKGLLVGLKFLTLGKVLVTGGSMLLTIVLESFALGWPFAVGLTMLIFIHESGHAIAAHRKGIGWSAMLFIPFFGAMYAGKRGGKTVGEDAFIGIMGPVFGTIGGILCVLIYFVNGSIFWLHLARFNFLMNLFNLLPTVPLDGGWIVPVFSSKILAFGVVLLLLVGFHNPMIWILAMMSLPRIIGGWKADPETQPYYRVKPGERWIYGVSYIALAAFLAFSGIWLTGWIRSIRFPFV